MGADKCRVTGGASLLIIEGCLDASRALDSPPSLKRGAVLSLDLWTSWTCSLSAHCSRNGYGSTRPATGNLTDEAREA